MNKIFIVEKVDGNGRRWWEIHERFYILGFKYYTEEWFRYLDFSILEFNSYEDAKNECFKILKEKEFKLKARQVRVVKETEFVR